MNRVQSLVDMIHQQFSYRVLVGLFKHDVHNLGSLEINTENDLLIMRFKHNENIFILHIPLPFTKNGLELINVGGVTRPTCVYLNKRDNLTYDYIGAVSQIMLGNPLSVLPEKVYKGKTNTMQLIKYGYENDTLALSIKKIQRQINFLVNLLPVHKTDMNSWAMNQRISIIDPIFDEMDSPEDKHDYQVAKNLEYFNKGWTSLGLSDGSLSGFNYTLSTDLRKLTPFGLSHHNPQRNLYSTLGMRGDEQPLIQTKSMSDLAEKGISRTGWNLFTAFVDIPDVWEDQIMVDASHTNKCIEYTKRFICFGIVAVSKGEKINTGDLLYVNKSGEKRMFDVVCDSAIVEDVCTKQTVVGGLEIEAFEVIIIYKRYLKEGTKITNTAANKGVIRLKDLGYAIDPRTGERRNIDVIVSSKAVMKRKNFTQVLEAVLNTISNDTPVIIPDESFTSQDNLKSALKSIDFNEEGVWECETYAGNLKCVCGKVFWGVTHDADDTLWKENAVEIENGRGIRTSGLKFSTIEFRALNTRFGNNNALEKEILSHAQGSSDISEQINILRSKLGMYVNNSEVVNISDITPLETSSLTFYSEESLANTIADTTKRQKGFYLKLPIKYQTVINEDDVIVCDGYPGYVEGAVNDCNVKINAVIDKIYVPNYNLRKCWKHDIGKFGANDISAALNTVIILSKKYLECSAESTIITRLYKAIYSYFKLVGNKLSTKRGELSVLGTSVRYPHSAKAVATLSNNLPENVVQIHSSMANKLKVKEGDIVLVERFPCLGFMSIRPQKVTITEDLGCKFSIRVSKNSLGSLTLDFDGDNIYIASFHTPESIALLKQEWEAPNTTCYNHIKRFNEKMGFPRTKEMLLSDYKIAEFPKLTTETHAEIVSKLTGVKSYTGPVVALAYNLLRIMENSNKETSTEIKSGVEVFMDTVANSVFKQKHGKKSLHKIVTDAICTADISALVEEGFDQKVSEIVCNVIKQKALDRKITDLNSYHLKALKFRRSNIINRIVREENTLYFTSRANLATNTIVENLKSYKLMDIPSRIFHKIMTRDYRSNKKITIASGKGNLNTNKENDYGKIFRA